MSLRLENYCILFLYIVIFLTFVILLLKSIFTLTKFLKNKILYKIKPYSTLRDIEINMNFHE